MKLTMNKNEIALVKAMMIHLEENKDLGQLEELLSFTMDWHSSEFTYTYGRLAHKVQQHLGKFEVGVQ